MIKKSKEDTKHSWFVNMIVIGIIVTIVLVLVIVLAVVACRFKNNKQTKTRHDPDEFIRSKSEDKTKKISDMKKKDHTDNGVDNDKNEENSDNNNKDVIKKPSVESRSNNQVDSKQNDDEIESEKSNPNHPDPNFLAVLQSFNEKTSTSNKPSTNKITPANEAKPFPNKESYRRSDCTKFKPNKS